MMTTPPLTKKTVSTLLLISIFICLQVAEASRFSMSGPVLSITVKDPLQFVDSDNTPDDSEDLNSSGKGNDNSSSSSSSSSNNNNNSNSKPWLDISSLRPNVQWSVQTRGPPLPNWFPALKSLKGTLGYQYNDLKRKPSWMEATAKIALPGHETAGNELQIQPSYELKTGQTNLLLQANRGASYIFAQLNKTPQKRLVVQHIRSSVLWNLPFVALASLRLTPSIDIPRKDIACCMEAVTGGGGKTRAILNLEYENPTLALVYTPNDRHVIRPEISLYTANIIYQWQVLLGKYCDCGIFHLKVDPVSAVHLTWTDTTRSGGSWITDVRVPLDGPTTMRSLAADVRVKRIFKF